ncbi:hypothetical protein [Enterococcus sp. LJL90]
MKSTLLYEVRQIDTAKFSDIDTVTVSDILKLLEKKKLVQRMNPKNDTRAKVVDLTPNGLITTQKATEVVESIDLEFFNVLKQNEEQFLLFLKD